MKRWQYKNRPLTLQPLEIRRVLAGSLGWDGAGLGSAELSYHIEGTPRGLSQAETNAAIETALSVWATAADITFTQTNRSGMRDSIDFSFINIDGAGGTLAQAYFPDDVNPARIAGDVQFDISDAWEVGNQLGNRAFDLVMAAVHEIGHSLGLDHSHDSNSVLAPYISPSEYFTSLSSDDVSAIQKLYASAEAELATESEGEGEDDDSTIIEFDVDETISDTTSPLDDGTAVDETKNDTTDFNIPKCHSNEVNRAGGFGSGLMSIDAAAFMTRFDTSGDGAVTDDELSTKSWEKLVELEVDGDLDGIITLEELESAVSTARQNVFSEKDADTDGLLTEQEVGSRYWTNLLPADTNVDDAVSADEFNAFVAERAAGRSDFGRHAHHRHLHNERDVVFTAFSRFGGNALVSRRRF